MKAPEVDPQVLVNRYERLILSFISKYNHGRYGLETDEVLQETKVRLWRVLENGHDIRYLSSYIHKIVYSIVLSHFKHLDRERSASYSEELRPYLENSPVWDAPDDHREDMKAAIRGALNSLRESRRTVLELTLSGLSIHEIAERQNWSLKKTYSLYERSLKDIKRVLRSKGICS
jgi:RNA polymerase sigma factor (sigma-70 family)